MVDGNQIKTRLATKRLLFPASIVINVGPCFLTSSERPTGGVQDRIRMLAECTSVFFISRPLGVFEWILYLSQEVKA